ncbi:hypothetical protein ACOME3_005560 [Neoechinorhynchus agilis]
MMPCFIVERFIKVHETAFLLSNSIFSQRIKNALILGIVAPPRSTKCKIWKDELRSKHDYTIRLTKSKLHRYYWDIDVWIRNVQSQMESQQLHELYMVIQWLGAQKVLSRNYVGLLGRLVVMMSDRRGIQRLRVSRKRREFGEDSNKESSRLSWYSCLDGSTSAVFLKRVFGIIGRAYPIPVRLKSLSRYLGVDLDVLDRMLIHNTYKKNFFRQIKGSEIKWTLRDKEFNNIEVEDLQPTIAIFVTNYGLYKTLIDKLTEYIVRIERIAENDFHFPLFLLSLKPQSAIIVKVPLINEDVVSARDTVCNIARSLLFKRYRSIKRVLIADIGTAPVAGTRLSVHESSITSPVNVKKVNSSIPEYENTNFMRNVYPGDVIVSHPTNSSGFIYAFQASRSVMQRWCSPKVFNLLDAHHWRLCSNFGMDKFRKNVKKPEDEMLDFFEGDGINAGGSL